MPLQWIIEGITEYVIEAVLEICGDLVGDKIGKKLLGQKYSSLTLGGKRPRATLKRRLHGYGPDEVDQPAQIIEKPTPAITDGKQTVRQPVTIVLKAMLGRDGKVRYVQPLQGGNNKQTRLAIKAARKIRFHPAQRNGFPVSQWIELKYEFGK